MKLADGLFIRCAREVAEKWVAICNPIAEFTAPRTQPSVLPDANSLVRCDIKTIVAPSNIDGCWVCRYPDIAYHEVIVDNACMQLVRDPTQYDMLVRCVRRNCVLDQLVGMHAAHITC